MTDPALWAAVELLAAYAQRTLSPLEATAAVIARIGRWEPHLHATYAFDPEAAMVQARASEHRWQRGEPIGALDGVPCMIKENIATRAVPVPLGTAATLLSPAKLDAPPAARLREAGALILGKTTMPDYGMLTSALSSFHALTRNPWNLGWNPGGSSSGAGAGVAAGYGPLHLGTDIGGSVRLPASLNGIVTLKPSLGRVPIDPPYPGRVAGPMTRSVADAALMMRVLAQPDMRDAMSLPHQPIDWNALEIDLRDLKGLRLGLLLDAGWGLPVAPAVRDAIEDAARAFEAAGAIVEPMPPISTREMIEGLDRFWRLRCWLDLQSLPTERRRRVLPYILRWAEAAAGYSAADAFTGYSQMAAMRDRAVRATHAYDAVLSPTMPVASFPAEWPSPQNDADRPFEHIAFTVPYNMSEQPAATVPCAFSPAGEPIGLQIAGRRHDDLGVLRIARAWERLRGPLRAWPEPPDAPSPARGKSP
jgi:aspartyl-tRNA(Asn)/glutamyl-tRNA(Gln) amidotransferase subunit A